MVIYIWELYEYMNEPSAHHNLSYDYVSFKPLSVETSGTAVDSTVMNTTDNINVCVNISDCKAEHIWTEPTIKC